MSNNLLITELTPITENLSPTLISMMTLNWKSPYQRIVSPWWAQVISINQNKFVFIIDPCGTPCIVLVFEDMALATEPNGLCRSIQY